MPRPAPQASVIRPTIAAIATAPGVGGVGVVRVSGGDLAPLIRAITGRGALVARLATFCRFRAADGAAIDEGLAIHFPSPHSYTGEDVLELQGHGGPVVLRMLLARCLALGCRLAEPGEFTKRAYLNNKLDLAQAESVADLIEASTESAVRAARASLSGVFSQSVNALVERLIRLRMLVEATLDFPEEEIDFLQAANARGQLEEIRATLDATLAKARQGALLQGGMKVVLAGRPNVGKSSLLNALSGAEVAIVTPVAGTTRDRVQQTIQIEGIALHIIDTAGLRETQDEVEQIGIARTWSAVDDADVVLRLLDARDPHTAADQEIDAEIARRVPGSVPRLRVLNKIDLLVDSVDARRAVPDNLLQPAYPEEPHLVRLSAKTGEGLDALRVQLLALIGYQSGTEDVFSARARHLTALQTSREHLTQAHSEAQHNAPALELFAEELRLAQDALSTITGEFTPDDLLGEIFTKFCIGK